MEYIRLSLGDWQYNAGIIGMYNILKYAGKDIYTYTKDYIKNHSDEGINSEFELIFPVEYLNNFTDNYFVYFIDTYINQISYGKIIGKKESIQDIINLSSNEITDVILKELNDYIKDTLQYYMKSASYNSAFELLEDSNYVLEILKDIKPIKLKKGEDISSKKKEIDENCRKILEVLKILDTKNWRRHLGGKNIIYSFLKNNWNGISVLNSQAKEKDIYKEFYNYFVKSVIDYIDEDKKRHRYICHTCENPIKNLENSLSFLNNTGFDTSRKPSNVWSFQNDIAICNICQLVYSCMPAGFYYGYDKGIFINANANTKSLINANENFKFSMIKSIDVKEQSATYKSIVESIIQSRIKNLEYELLDVSVIFFENEKYRFNILHKNILNTIYESREEFEKIKKGSFKENGKYYYLYEDTIRNIVENKNLFLNINKLLHYKISNRVDCYYNVRHIEQILKINLNYLKGVSLMENVDQKTITDMRNYGWYLRDEYNKKGSDGKIEGISYRLLNSLKTSNVNGFMDVLIRCYMYVGKEIPKSFVNSLKNEEEFKTNGYAFVIGLNGVDTRKENN